MPLIFIKDEKKDPLLLNPYASINRKIDALGEELDGKQVKYTIRKASEGFTDGFELDCYYCNDISLKFLFSRNKQSSQKNEDFLIHHVLEYSFEPDIDEMQHNFASEIKKRMDYLYFPEGSHIEYSYVIEKKHIQLCFSVLAEESSIKKVVDLLINQDILIFSRGW